MIIFHIFAEKESITVFITTFFACFVKLFSCFMVKILFQLSCIDLWLTLRPSFAIVAVVANS